MSFRSRLVLAVTLPLIILAIWYYDLVVNVIKPDLVPFSTAARATASTPDLADNSFSYPMLGITAPLTVSAQTSPMRTSDWNKIADALGKGVSLAYDQPDFGQARLAFITGHSSSLKPQPYGSVFAGLGQAEKGDMFRFRSQGQTYTYKVIDKKVLDPRDLNGFTSFAPAVGQPQRVALVACWPVLTTSKRIVIVGERQ